MYCYLYRFYYNSTFTWKTFYLIINSAIRIQKSPVKTGEIMYKTRMFNNAQEPPPVSEGYIQALGGGACGS